MPELDIFREFAADHWECNISAFFLQDVLSKHRSEEEKPWIYMRKAAQSGEGEQNGT